jgi:hypothetical protein
MPLPPIAAGAAAAAVREMVDALYRKESRRIFATLVRLPGDFDLAEEALHDGFRAALEQWPANGVPAAAAAGHRASAREWIGLAVIALPCMLYSDGPHGAQPRGAAPERGASAQGRADAVDRVFRVHTRSRPGGGHGAARAGRRGIGDLGDEFGIRWCAGHRAARQRDRCHLPACDGSGRAGRCSARGGRRRAQRPRRRGGCCVDAARTGRRGPARCCARGFRTGLRGHGVHQRRRGARGRGAGGGHAAARGNTTAPAQAGATLLG